MGNLTGEQVVRMLPSELRRKHVWILTAIETLTDSDALVLGDLWLESRKRPLEIDAETLCDALNQAAQVITLNISLKGFPWIELVIEDGELVCEGQ